MNIIKNLLICLIFLLTIFFSNSIYSQTGDSLYYTNPNYHISKELFNKKIVMLGDETHHSLDVYHSLMCVLNEWLNIAKESYNVQNLTLVIEYCSEDAEIVNKYVKDGDISPLLDYFSPNLFYEDIEYYTNLKNFYSEIEKINQTRFNKINFEIKGFEESSFGCNKLNDRILKSTLRERELWFVNKRDSLTSVGIINYNKSKTNEQIIIFYGSAHLQKGLVRKPSTVLSDSETLGYFLATYLKNELGDTNVISVRQKFISSNEFYDDNGLKIFNGKDTLISCKNIKISWETEYSDYLIIRLDSSRYFYPHRLDFTFTNKLLKKYVEDGTKMQTFFPLEEASIHYNADLFFINFITANNFANIEEAQEWMNKNAYNGLEMIESPEFASKIFNLYYVSKNKNFLNQLGFEDRIIDSTFKPDTNYWKNTYWSEQKKLVKFMNCIGIFWIGYPDEQIKAKEYLKEFSGEDFVLPEKYLQWYRMKYYNYKY